MPLSPELETLDQLPGGDFLAIIRTLYPSDIRFLQGILGLLSPGDIRLLSPDGNDLPQWQWREFVTGLVVPTSINSPHLRITDSGVRGSSSCGTQSALSTEGWVRAASYSTQSTYPGTPLCPSAK
jgi:hypothetical protein